jgi:phage tail-like protein
MANFQVADHRSQLNTDPIRSFKFVVDIYHSVAPPAGSPSPLNGSTRLGFTSVDGLSATINSIPYRQGGANTTMQQIPGQTTFSPISMQKGVLLGDRAQWDWLRQVFAVLVGTGNAGNGDNGNPGFGFRATVDISLLQHPWTQDGKVPAVAIFRLYNAWPSAVTYSSLNSGDNAFLVAGMTLQHEGFEVFMSANSQQNASYNTTGAVASG